MLSKTRVVVLYPDFSLVPDDIPVAFSDAGPIPFHTDIVDQRDTKAFLRFCYKKLGCELIDICHYSIDGKPFDFIVDDEGLFREKVVPSGLIASDVSPSGFEVLFTGPVIIAGDGDKAGYHKDLSMDDLQTIFSHIAKVSAFNEETGKDEKFFAVVCDSF